MPVANIQEVESYFTENKDSDDVKNFIAGIVTPDRVNSFLDTDEGSKVLRPRLDKHTTKGIETWKTKNLQGLIDAEVAKRNPAETEEQKRLKALENENLKTQNMLKRESLKSSALKNLKDPNLADLVEFMIGDDEDTTQANIGILESTVTKVVEEAVKEIFKTNGRTPPGSDGNPPKGGGGMNAIIRKAAGL